MKLQSTDSSIWEFVLCIAREGKMYKLIATDLDDTLLNDDGVISEENREAIQRAEAEGVKIIVASGRSYASTKQYIDELSLKNLTISLNGAYVQDHGNGTLVAGVPIDRALTKEILEAIAPLQLHTNFYCGEKVYCIGPSAGASFYGEMNRIEMDYVDSLVELSKTEQAGKLLIYSDHETLKPIKAMLDQRYGKTLNIVFSKPYFLEVTDRTASKGAALLKVAEHYGIHPEEIIAIGDSENDLSMIQKAGLGIAMANAKDKIKNAADFVTRSNNENGVAYAINRFIFGEDHEQGGL